MKNTKIKRIAICAMMIAIATVLSIFPKIEAPLGGSVTLGSMVPIMLISILYGIKWGLPVAVGYSVIQLLLSISMISAWGLTPGIFVGCIIFDYFLAFSVICVAGLFGSDKLSKIIIGTVVAGLLRYLCHIISGYFFFGAWAGEGFSPLTWSFFYNGAFMIPEIIICVVIMCALYKLIPRLKNI